MKKPTVKDFKEINRVLNESKAKNIATVLKDGYELTKKQFEIYEENGCVTIMDNDGKTHLILGKELYNELIQGETKCQTT